MIRWFPNHPVYRWFILGALVAALALATWFLRGEFASFHEKRLMSAAQASFERGDLQSAVLSCRQLLQANPNYSEAYRLLVAINEQANSPEAIGWALKLADSSHNDP